MDEQQNREIARRWVDAVNRQDLGALDDLIDDSLVDHSGLTGQHGRGREGHKNLIRGWRRAFPDWQATIDDITVEGDMVTVRYHATATHRGEFMGQRPDNRRKEMSAVETLRIANGKIVEHWTVDAPFGRKERPPRGGPRPS
jgi:predicted ester cyclase